MRVALIFDKWREDTLGIYFERAFEDLGVIFDHWWLKDTDKMSTDYDLYVRIDHGDYSRDLPKKFSPSVFYAIDTHLGTSWKKIRRSVTSYDMVFFCHREATLRYPRAQWLPVACDPVTMDGKKSWPACDIAFVGNDGGIPRKFVLQAIRERYSSHRIGKADATDLFPIYQSAKIGFNFSIRNEINMRMFEILGSGTLLATNAVPSEDLRLLGLIEGEHFIKYPENKKLYDVLDHWLDDDQAQARECIAQQGQAWALSGHTYKHRAQALLTQAAAQLGLENQNLEEKV